MIFCNAYYDKIEQSETTFPAYYSTNAMSPNACNGCKLRKK